MLVGTLNARTADDVLGCGADLGYVFKSVFRVDVETWLGSTLGIHLHSKSARRPNVLVAALDCAHFVHFRDRHNGGACVCGATPNRTQKHEWPLLAC